MDKQTEREENHLTLEQLEKCILRNFEGNIIGIGDILHYWNNDGRWCCFQVDTITINEGGIGNVSGPSPEGARGWSKNHECFTTSDEDEAFKMRLEKQEGEFRKSNSHHPEQGEG